MWKEFDLDVQSTIIKHRHIGEPFPLYDEDILNEYRMPCTPIFTIKTWGTKGYR